MEQGIKDMTYAKATGINQLPRTKWVLACSKVHNKGVWPDGFVKTFPNQVGTKKCDGDRGTWNNKCNSICC